MKWHPLSALVKCTEHGLLSLTREQYQKCLENPDADWQCPVCGNAAIWDNRSLETNPPVLERGDFARFLEDQTDSIRLRMDTHNQELYDFDKQAEKVAAERGQVVVYPESNQLQLDIDTEEAMLEFEARLASFDIYPTDNILYAFDTVTPWMVKKPSASGHPHYHVTISFPNSTFKDPAKGFTEAERIAYQFALGSDPIREYLNAARMWQGVENASRLFEPKPQEGDLLVNEKPVLAENPPAYPLCPLCEEKPCTCDA